MTNQDILTLSRPLRLAKLFRLVRLIKIAKLLRCLMVFSQRKATNTSMEDDLNFDDDVDMKTSVVGRKMTESITQKGKTRIKYNLNPHQVIFILHTYAYMALSFLSGES